MCKDDPTNKDGGTTHLQAHCIDCDTLEGQLHIWPCEYEECPICGKHIFGGCKCASKHFGCDLTEVDDSLWQTRLEEIGRIPFIYWPLLCSYCGKRFPDFFMVPDQEWQHYISPSHRKDIICKSCYAEINGKIDRGGSALHEGSPFPKNALRELYKSIFDLRGVSSMIRVMSCYDGSLTRADLVLLNQIDQQVLVWVRQLEKRFGRKRLGKTKPAD